MAQALFGNPDILLLDEPTNHLDLKTVTWLENFLSRLHNAVIIASHDHKLVSTVANRIVEITPGGIIDVMKDFDEYLAMEEASLPGENDYLRIKRRG